MKTNVILILYVIVAFAQLYACWPPMHVRLRYATKLMLMPLLAIWFLFATNPTPMLVFGGIICGFFGDLLLLEAKRKSFFFMVGSTFFGIGHILYITYFLSHAETGASPWVIVIAACCYLAALVPFLKKLRKGMGRVTFIAFTLYFLILCTMNVSALVYGIGNGSSWHLLPYFGAVFFIFSDGYLSYDKFVKKLPYRHVVVMVTYMLAQMLIACGVFLNSRGII